MRLLSHTFATLVFILSFAFSPMESVVFANPDLSWTRKVGARTEPKAGDIYNVVNYGAKADGQTINTKAIQAAIEACAKAGGGKVTFSPGKYLTGAIFLRNNVELEIPRGVTLLGSTRIEDYPEIDTRIAGIEMRWPAALINVLDGKQVMISGNGIVHAQGKLFWDKYWTMRKDYEARGLRWIVDYDCKRPRTILVSESADVTIKDVTLQQAGFWTIQLLYSSFCTVNGVVIQNNVGGHGPSTDGIDIDSSSHILVENCDIDCNDDNFCLKSGRDADGLRVNRPTEYVVIRNCVSRAGSGLLTCGSETSGGIRYVYAQNLKAQGTKVGFRLKSAMNRGGTTEHIYVENIEMDQVGLVFEASLNWNPAYSYSQLPKEYEGKDIPEHWKKMLEPVSPEKGLPHFHTIYLSDIRVTNGGTFIRANGSEQSLVRNMHISNIDAHVEKAGSIAYAADWSFENACIRPKDMQPIQVKNSREVRVPSLDPEEYDFTYKLKTGVSHGATIHAAKHPEFAFTLPEIAGNLKFGILSGNKSKWLHKTNVSVTEQQEDKLVYKLTDPLLGKGELTVTALSISHTDGLIVEVKGEQLPSNVQLFWSYGGALGELPKKDQPVLLRPAFCADNVFSVERTSFTLYYGESMRLKTIHAVMPLDSDIRLSDAFRQNTPLDFYNSGKKTLAPALAATLPLPSSQPVYFCVYRQNQQADYNYFMLPNLFNEQLKKKK